MECLHLIEAPLLQFKIYVNDGTRVHAIFVDSSTKSIVESNTLKVSMAFRHIGRKAVAVP